MSAAESMLEALPPYEAEDPSVKNVMAVLGAELDRVSGAALATVLNLFPQNADDSTIHLRLLERLFAVLVPASATIDQRRANLLAHLRGRTSASGLTWIARMSELLGNAWTHSESGYTVTIRVPFSASGATYAQAVPFSRRVTPAHLDVVIVNLDRFLVEDSSIGDPL